MRCALFKTRATVTYFTSRSHCWGTAGWERECQHRSLVGHRDCNQNCLQARVHVWNVR